jgi:hypothetical protein
MEDRANQVMQEVQRLARAAERAGVRQRRMPSPSGTRTDRWREELGGLPHSEVYLRFHKEAAFWARVERPVDPEACWRWLGGVDGKGVGRIIVRTRSLSAPRVAWEFSRNTIALSLLVVNCCGEARCVRPEHHAVMTRHKLSTLSCTRRTLTPETAAQMRELFRTGTSRSDLRTRFGVSAATVSRVLRRRIWKVPLKPAQPIPKRDDLLTETRSTVTGRPLPPDSVKGSQWMV